MSRPERHENFPLDALIESVRGGEKCVDLAGIQPALLPFLLPQLQRRLRRPVLVVSAMGSDALRLAADLRFHAGQSAVELLPEIDASPYGHLSPDRGAVMRLLAGLARLAWDQAGPLIVTSAATLSRRLVPSGALLDHSYVIGVGDVFDRKAMLGTLADGGYRSVGTVEDQGTFAVRGGIIDVFPPHLERPVRIELWGDEVESILNFDAETQRTRAEEHQTLVCPPVREEFLIKPYKDRARQGILDAAGTIDMPTRKLQPILDDLANSIPFMGLESFRPAFFESMDSVLDYVPRNTVICLIDPMGVAERLRFWWESLLKGHENALEEKEPSLPADAHAINPSELLRTMEGWLQIRSHVVEVIKDVGIVDAIERGHRFEVPDNQHLTHALTQVRGDNEPLRPLAEWVRDQVGNGARVVLAARQETQLDRLQRVLKGFGVPVERSDEPARSLLRPPKAEEAGAVLLRGEITGGFSLPSHGFSLVTEAEIFGRRAPRRARKKTDQASPFIQSFRELSPGDFVVHADHGIGKYIGLTRLAAGPHENDFLLIEFAGADKLYLPVYKLGRLQKYVGGSQGNPRIDKLGGTNWNKVRSKARAAAEEDALAMLDLYARRELAEGYPFSLPDDYFRSFEATFPFEETPDQAQAIDEVIDDMTRARPMDRLLCGDVGFGKTEVALRAAMKAVLDGKQVCILAPTTVLASQHFRTFTDRFSDYPIKVAPFSRMIDRDDLKQNLADLKLGRIDIAVGTHRLLSKDIRFHDLGLLILDEEHRFGVKDKERLKELRANVDVLAMTATPIPRTLQMSISGIRDLSVITTPPQDRLSVRTYVCRATEQVVRDAILRELSRGGQIFFVHNRVQSIDARAAWLRSLVPEARIIVGHGQMDPKKLERVMLDFTEGRFNVLLSTTIIESGIDIPTANTMLIDSADRFGLAQLYQLRGRVGRSRERGYCYLLVPSELRMQPEARARLAVIQKFTELGSGFHVASHDLELRGAGEMLGTRQKGQVHAVGIDLYAQLLDEAVRKLRGEAPRVEFDPDVNLQINARIPEDYIPDNQLRLVMYKRLANAQTEESVIAVAEEMNDRFGESPAVVQNLCQAMRIRTLARFIGLKTVDQGPRQAILTFDPASPMPVAAIIGLVRDPDSRFHAPADFKLVYTFDADERRDTLSGVRIALQRLAEFVTEQA